MINKSLKKICLGVTGILMLMSMVSCGNTSKTGSAMDKDTLVIGLDDAFAPMGFKDENGEITGFDVELAIELGAILGKQVQFQPIDWTMKESELNAGNIDLIWNGYTINEDRMKKVDFSVPYLKNRQVIVTLIDSDINSKKDLEGKVVGAQSESSAISAMEKDDELYSSFNGGKAVTFEDNNQALMDLEAGRVDAIVADEILVKYYISLKGEENFKILSEDFGDEEYGVGIRKGDTAMVEAFNEAYKEMQDNGDLAEISKKWFGDDITIKID